MKLFLMPALLSFLLSMPTSAEIHTGNGYSMDYSNWFMTKYPSFDMMALAPSNSTGTYHENISVVVTKHPYENVSDWDSIKKYQLKSLKQVINDFSLEGWDPVNIDGQEGRKITYTGSYMNFKLRWIQFNALKNGNWYTITFISDEKDHSRYYMDAMKIIKSFRFK